MNSEEWKKVKAVFHDASELPKAERSDFLARFSDRTRLAVEKLLAAPDEEGLFLNTPIVAFNKLDEDLLPKKIGDYQIIRKVGEGGMGTVYEAVRETEVFKQHVALKVIRRGMNNDIILKRFRAEQQILASLEHPNIGRFLDGGKTAEGLPFYAMEFIEGLPIDEYCRENDLSTENKISLFREVCSAVSYAHTNLIVHRDLKPSNIIVTRNGTPKLLDFGIAKVLDIENNELGTATQFGMMTPQYASPEQIRGEKVTTLSDVYSLGVILYEILTNRKPYTLEDKNYAEILEIITSTEPRKPSSLNSKFKINNAAVDGEIDTVVLKALQKSPDRRYQSVERFSDDLRRRLAGLPISARPDTFQYRFGKFIGRNKIAVAAGILVFLSLLAGIAVAGWQAYRAEQQRVLAERRFTEVRTIANNVVFKYHDEIEKLNGSTAVREMLVRDATVYLDNLAKDADGDVDLERELGLAYLRLGDVQGKIYAANTGNTAGALDSYQKSIILLERVATAKPLDIAAKDDLINANDALVSLMSRTYVDKKTKFDILNRNAQLIEEILDLEPKDPKRLGQLATLYVRYGDSVGGINDKDSLLQKLDYHKKALPLVDELVRIGTNDPEILRIIARTNQRIGTDYIWLGENAEMNNRFDEAKAYFSQALPFHQAMYETIQKLARILPDDKMVQRNIVAGSNAYSMTLSRNSRRQEALELAERSMILAKEIGANDPNNREARFDIAESYNLFAKIYERAGEDGKAVENLKSALAICEEMFRSDEKNIEAFSKTLGHISVLVKLCEKSGNRTEAEMYRQKLKELQESRKNKGNPDKS